MKISLKNCNNIISGSIELSPNRLNIKYGANGTGKSTIAKSIESAVNDKLSESKTLSKLTPFSSTESQPKAPEVLGVDEIESIKIFNERYIEDFIFREDELIKGSFNIFIKDQNYDAGLEKISSLLNELQNKLSGDPDLANIIKDFDEISGSFGKPTQSGLINGSSGIAKALKSGNKVANIPEGLESFKTFIQHTNNYKWLKWQIDGNSFLDISNDCPFCVSDTSNKKELISKIPKIYDPKSVENLEKIISVFDRLKKYFSDQTQQKIIDFVKNIDGYSEDQSTFLMQVKGDIDALSSKFISAQSICFNSLKDVEGVIQVLTRHKIDPSLYVYLSSTETISKINLVNESIESLIKTAGSLQGHVSRHKDYIQSVILQNITTINNFLRNAGYKYEVDITEEGDTYKLKLNPIAKRDIFVNADAHLSFGERNAFALVLFMHDAIKSAANLIVLDDPISSFDKNKKYAIMEALFSSESALRGKTVLLLTHDFEPIVDLLKVHANKFQKPFVTFLENWNGTLSELIIDRQDIKNYIEINEINISRSVNDISKLIYLRRKYEVLGLNASLEYSLISSLLHKKSPPTIKLYNDSNAMTEREMSSEEVVKGSNEVKKIITNFNFDTYLELVNNDEEMKKLYLQTSCGYERLHLFRIIFDNKPQVIKSSVINKFINETFHVENNYVFHLNPNDYPLVPQYVVDACDTEVDKLN